MLLRFDVFDGPWLIGIGGNITRNWLVGSTRLLIPGLLVVQEKRLEKMSGGDNGRPYTYPNALMLIILVVEGCFGSPYRQTEGFARQLGGTWGAKTPSYTQIYRRQKWGEPAGKVGEGCMGAPRVIQGSTLTTLRPLGLSL